MDVLIPCRVNIARLRMERARMNWTKTELAEKTGLTRFAIRDLENGRRKKVSVVLLKKIANIYNVDINELIEKEETIC